MQSYIYSAVGILLILSAAAGQVANATDTTANMHEISGETTNDLEPVILISKQQTNWDFGINFTGPTNVPRDTWLKITNRVGSKIELWQNDGTKLQLKDEDALAALRLPAQTSISEATAAINRRWRGGQWLRLPTHMGRRGRKVLVPIAAFDLTKLYGASFTNEVVIKITPLLYKADTNETVHLVDFPPITLKLMTNGDVQKVTAR